MIVPAALVVILLGLVVRPAPQAPGAVSPHEREVLIDLYAGTGGPRWTRQAGWGSATSVCDWDGVFCDYADGDAKRPFVAALNLALNNLEGTLPLSLTTLPRLQTLNVAGNRLSGPLPEPLLQRWDEQHLELSAGGNAFTNLVARVSMTSSAGGVLCAEHEDVRFRLDIDAVRRRAVFQSIRCDSAPSRRTHCLVREGTPGSVAEFSRALQQLRFTGMGAKHDHPFTGQTHGVTLMTTAVWGDGSRTTVETYDRQGPRDVWIAQQLFLSLQSEVSWDREVRKPTCDMEP